MFHPPSVANPIPSTSRLRIFKILIIPLAIGLPLSGSTAEAPDLAGAELYQQFCASCHGAHAHGDGPVAETLKVRVPDLTSISKRNGGQFPTQNVQRFVDGQTVLAAHGSRDMPVWGWEFYGRKYPEPEQRKRSDELSTRLVDYLRSIQR